MAIDVMRNFYKGAALRSGLKDSGEAMGGTVMDNFKTRNEYQQKMALEQAKSQMMSPLDRQKIKESEAKVSTMNNTGMDPDGQEKGIGLSGEDYLNAAVPKQYHDVVRQMANMHITGNDVSLRGTNPMIRAQAKTWATRYRPGFNAQNVEPFQKLKSDYTVGDPAKAMRSLNTSLMHMGTFTTQMKDLHDKGLVGGQYPMLNNLFLHAKAAFGNGDLAEVSKTTKTLSTEVPKALRGAGVVPEQEIKSWEQEFGSADSPEQVERGLKSATELLGGQLQSRTGFYRETAKRLGAPEDQQNLPEDVSLLPETRNALQKAGLLQSFRSKLGYGDATKNSSDTSGGETKNVNGVQYQRQEDGKWHRI